MINFPVAYLNSNDGSGLLAFGDGKRISAMSGMALHDLDLFIEYHKKKFIFGYLGYDLKNELENLNSKNLDNKEFPDLFFWVPKYVVKLQGEHFEFVQGDKTKESFEFLNYFLEEETDQNFHSYKLDFQPTTSKEKYLENVIKLKEVIQQGDIYEINYCQEFLAENVDINFSLDTYFKLNNITKAPFSSYVQFDEYTIFCGSPERYIKREGDKLLSQPIKGTAKRNPDKEQDELLKEQLKTDPKERAENVMIVDLVRNDLSKIATKNSVVVDELCGIYSFKTVHQMVSTVSCELKEKTSFTDVLRATFPMGSMTGAPKVSAMELIEEFENFKRGIYSGSIGYIDPEGDFDFNVVIRSLFYNKKKKMMTCDVGGAITIQSDPEKEYEECLTKVQKILNGMNE
ncbi:anthranilate synthase component I family protein [Crocinitomicaceae bacterium]|nr:anthranilate synthase component I family protein [Crocinitomicaceae bacterium]MDG1347676.1 anthranilate synthase component I family protein [Crocinitomicaceae bacterium]